MLEGKALRLDRRARRTPPVSILQPVRPDSTLPETELAVTLGDARWSDVTLFHNDRPIETGLEKRQCPPLTVKTRLVKGVNRFAVMASRENADTSLSDPVEVTYDGSMEPSRLHIVALGVGDYDERRKLKYARADASRISEVLNARGLDAAGKPGRRSSWPTTK